MSSISPIASPQRTIRALVAINLTLLSALAVMVLSGFTLRSRRDVVLSVERLNIVDSLGHPVLVLANGPRLPGAVFHGKEYAQGRVTATYPGS